MKPPNIPFWKKWLSYIKDIPIETTSSDYNNYLEVCLSKGRYQLCTENAIYSYADLYDNFTNTFRSMDWEDMEVEHVLILGFGLGSIPYMLEHTFNKDFYYTAVEIDPVILELADKYVLPDIKSSINFINADAYAFLLFCEEQYDMICVDIFQDDVVPEEFEDPDFLEKLSELLNPKGVLLFNRLAMNEKESKATKDFYENYFLKAFPKGSYHETNGNWVLISDKSLLKNNIVR